MNPFAVDKPVSYTEAPLVTLSIAFLKRVKLLNAEERKAIIGVISGVSATQLVVQFPDDQELLNLLRELENTD